MQNHDPREDARASLLSLFQQKPQNPQSPEVVQSTELTTTFTDPSEDQNQTTSNIDPTVANTDRQAALLNLLGTVGVKSGGTPPPQQRASSANGSNSGGEAHGKALLEQLMAGSLSQQQSPPQVPLPSVSPTSSIDHEQRVKSLFDFSPFEGLTQPMPGPNFINQQQFPQQAPQATAAVAPSPARKKPVPAYNPSPALAPVTSPHVSPRLQSIQQRLTPSPPPLNRQQSQQQQQQFQPQMQQETTSINDLRTSSRGSDPSEDHLARMGVQHGPLPPIPQGQEMPGGAISLNQGQQRLSPQTREQRQQQNLQQLQAQLYPSPPLRPAHPPPAQHQRQSPPPQQQQQQQQQQGYAQQPQQPQQTAQQPQPQQSSSRGRGSPVGGPALNRNSGFVRESQANPSVGVNANLGQVAAKRNVAAKTASMGGGNNFGQQQQQPQQPPQQQQQQPPPPQQQQQQQQPQSQPQQQQKGSRVSSASMVLQQSTITIDVLAPLASTLARTDIAEVTPIALLKLEPTYISGTTIGVANFIAYSMTRGRVRLIGRDSGTRALLRLPATFAQNASVQDMMVCGSKLACVTNDGGLVVWDVEGTIEDDKPVQFTIVLHVLPTPDSAGFKVVKWHPKQNGQLAVASEKEIYLVDVKEAHEAFGQEAVRQDELSSVAKVFSIPSPLVSFTFDVPQIALASISIDSTVTLWSIKDKLPFWSGRVSGEGYPSSIDFLEGGLVVGRNQGNVLQLLPIMSTTVLSTIKFVLGNKDKSRNTNGSAQSAGGATPGAESNSDSVEDLMFGHLSYDPTMKTLWVANSARSSLFAIRMGIDSTPLPNSDATTLPTIRPCFEQIVEFPSNMPTINLTIVAEGDPAHSETWGRDPSLAVQAFSVHAGGVDQINIEKEAFEAAFTRAQAKLPNISYENIPIKERKSSTQGAPMALTSQSMPPPAPAANAQSYSMPQTTSHSQVRGGAEVFQQQQQAMQAMGQPRMRTSPVYGLGLGDATGAPISGFEPSSMGGVPAQVQQPLLSPSSNMANIKGKAKEIGNNQGAGVGGRRQQGSQSGLPSFGMEIQQQQQQQPLQQANAPAARGVGIINSPAVQDISVAGPATPAVDGGLIVGGLTKEIRKVEDSLHTRIGRLIVKELDKQQVRLEEVRHADQTADFERQEKILKLISTELTKNTTRVVEQAVKSVVQNSVLPALETVTKTEVKAALNGQIAKGLSESMKQTLPTEVEKLLLRPDVSNHVATTFSQAITPLVQRHVTDSITKTLIPAYTQASSAMHQELSREIHSEILGIKKEIITWQSEAIKGTENLMREMESSIRSLSEQVKMLSVQVANNNAAASSSRSVAPSDSSLGNTDYLRQPSSQSLSSSYQNPPQYMQQAWGAPPPSQSQVTAPPPPPASQPTNQPRVEDWDEIFLTNLGLQDPKQLRELLFKCQPDVIMPVGQLSPLSQAVVLTLILRLALSLTELSPVEEAFKSSLWWLQRAAYTLHPNDNVIAPYVQRVLNTAQSSLGTTYQRLNILPGGPSSVETNNMISQIQQTLSTLMT